MSSTLKKTRTPQDLTKMYENLIAKSEHVQNTLKRKKNVASRVSAIENNNNKFENLGPDLARQKGWMKQSIYDATRNFEGIKSPPAPAPQSQQHVRHSPPPPPHPSPSRSDSSSTFSAAPPGARFSIKSQSPRVTASSGATHLPQKSPPDEVEVSWEKGVDDRLFKQRADALQQNKSSMWGTLKKYLKIKGGSKLYKKPKPKAKPKAKAKAKAKSKPNAKPKAKAKAKAKTKSKAKTKAKKMLKK